MKWGRATLLVRASLFILRRQRIFRQHIIHKEKKTVKRRNTLAAIASLTLLAISSPSQSSGPLVTVFKTPTCGCCGKWVEHLKANGFTVKVQEVNDTSAYERQHRVPGTMVSCHPAVVNGYTIEGHVPAPDIKRLLNERPKVVGLAVPGMPVGSPGLEAAHSEAFSVFVFDEGGHASVYARYPAR
jgi:hypothetical protein